MNVQEKTITEEEYEDYLNECYPPVTVCGMEMQQGSILKEMDPIAFRCGLSEEPIKYECGECGTEYDNFDDAEECCKEGEE